MSKSATPFRPGEMATAKGLPLPLWYRYVVVDDDSLEGCSLRKNISQHPQHPVSCATDPQGTPSRQPLSRSNVSESSAIGMVYLHFITSLQALPWLEGNG